MSRTTLYLLASEGAFAVYIGPDAQHLRQLVHRTAASLGDVDPVFRHQEAHGHTSPGGVSFVVGEEPGDKMDRARAAMAHHAVEAVERLWPAAGADSLVVAAGPKMLGALRDAMPKALAAKVTAELHKDLLNLPEHELASHLDRRS